MIISFFVNANNQISNSDSDQTAFMTIMEHKLADKVVLGDQADEWTRFVGKEL